LFPSVCISFVEEDLSLSDCIELDNNGDILYDIELYWGVNVDDGINT